MKRPARRSPVPILALAAGVVATGLAVSACQTSAGEQRGTLPSLLPAPPITVGSSTAPTAPTTAPAPPTATALAPPPPTETATSAATQPTAAQATTAQPRPTVPPSSTDAVSALTTTTVVVTTRPAPTTTARPVVAGSAQRLLGSWVLQLGSVRAGASGAQVDREVNALATKIGTAVSVIDGDRYADLTDGTFVYLAGPFATKEAALATCAQAGLPSPGSCLARFFSG